MERGDLVELAREPSSEKRSALLRRITDLFFDGGSERNVSEKALFDEVVLRVLADLDVAARAAFSESAADKPDASRRIILTLARDEIAVARPVIERSPVLTDADLAELAAEGAAPHLQAIARRRALQAIVTDVLLRRGDALVRHLLAANAGARFSMQGFDRLMRYARTEEPLQYDLAARADLPPEAVEALSRLLAVKLQHTLRTMGLKSSQVQAPGVVDRLRASLESVVGERGREVRDVSATIDDVRMGVSSIDHAIMALANADRGFDLASLASDLLSLDHATVVKALAGPREEPLVVVFRCLDASWEAFQSVLKLRARRRKAPYAASQSLADLYAGMERITAMRVLRFLQTRRTTQARAAG